MAGAFPDRGACLLLGIGQGPQCESSPCNKGDWFAFELSSSALSFQKPFENERTDGFRNPLKGFLLEPRVVLVRLQGILVFM